MAQIPVSVSSLNEIIFTTRPKYWSRNEVEDKDPLYRSTSGVEDCDEVFPGVFIGDCGAAKNRDFLKRLKITHVLNSAEGSKFGMVDTNAEYYKGVGIKYLGLKLMDLPMTNIAEHFQLVAQFIEDGVKNGGRVFVHCLMGISRSSTCVLAYLIMKQDMTVTEALKTVRQRRDVRPNDGFLRQLIELNQSIQNQKSNNTKL